MFKMKGPTFFNKKSPFKEKVETPMAPNTTEKKKSKKIGPAISDKMQKDLLNKRSDAEMNLSVSDEQAAKDGAKITKKIKEERSYIKK